MSFFSVQLKKLSKVYPHPNADKLELGQVEGLLYQFCIPKGTYKNGDEVVYFPVDSVLSQEFISQQNIANFLGGAERNRVKTCTLRGEISQGYVAPVDSVKSYLKIDTLPEDLTAALGVIKYEAPEIMTPNGKLIQLPEHVYKYDIESCDNYPDIVEKLMDMMVVITEKLEGTNMAVSVNEAAVVSVCQHGNAIELIDDQTKENTYWKTAKKDGLITLAQQLQSIFFKGMTVTVRAEMIGPGIQGNYYQLKEHTSRIFDIDVNGKPLSYPVMKDSVKTTTGSAIVPEIAYNVKLMDWLAGRTIQQASNGKSLLVNRLREGVVIKPMEEVYEIGFGRLFLKQRDPIYLDKTGK
jgi:RNA ligase (TIGR02306 family)